MSPSRPSAIAEDIRSHSCAIHPDATLHLELAGFNLTNVATGFFSNRTSSPLFKVCAYQHNTKLDNPWEPVAISESVAANITDPIWPLVRVRCQEAAKCDLERPIRIQIYDAGQDPEVPMGHFDTTVKELLNRQNLGLINIHNSFKFSLMQEQNVVGEIAVVTAMIEIEAKEEAAMIEIKAKQEEEEKAAKKQQPEAAAANPQEEQPLGDRKENKDKENSENQQDNGNNNNNGIMGWFGRSSVTAEEVKPKPEDIVNGGENDNIRQDRKDKERQSSTKREDKERQSSTRKDDSKRRPSSGTNSVRSSAGSRSSTASKKRPQQPDRLRLVLKGTNLEEMPVGIGEEVAVNRYCVISKFQWGQAHDGNLFKDIFQSKTVPHNRNPQWEEWKLNMDELCGNELDVPVTFTLWEDQVPMGTCESTVRELLRKQPMTLIKGRKIRTKEARTMGTLQVVEAEIIKAPKVLPESKKSTAKAAAETADDNEKEEEVATAVPGWLAYTLSLAAGLVGQDDAAQETPASESEGGEDVKEAAAEPKRDGAEKDDVKRDEDTTPTQEQRQKQHLASGQHVSELQPTTRPSRPASSKNHQNIHMITNLIELAEAPDSDDDDDDDSSQSSTDSDDDDISIADVISIAEQSMMQGSKNEREGLMQLSRILTTPTPSPKKKVATRATAAEIMANMPKWDLDGDSVAGASRTSRKGAKQRREKKEREATDDVDPYKDKCDVAWNALQKKRSQRVKPVGSFDDLDDDTIAEPQQPKKEEKPKKKKGTGDKDKDAVVPSKEEAKKAKKAKKKQKKAAKKHVRRTLRNIHRILTNNLKTIPEGPTPEEEVMNELEKAEREKELQDDPFVSVSFDMGKLPGTQSERPYFERHIADAPSGAKSERDAVVAKVGHKSSVAAAKRKAKKSFSIDFLNGTNTKTTPKRSQSSDDLPQQAKTRKSRSRRPPNRAHSNIEDDKFSGARSSGNGQNGARRKSRRDRRSRSQERTLLDEARKSARSRSRSHSRERDPRFSPLRSSRPEERSTPEGERRTGRSPVRSSHQERTVAEDVRKSRRSPMGSGHLEITATGEVMARRARSRSQDGVSRRRGRSGSVGAVSTREKQKLNTSGHDSFDKLGMALKERETKLTEAGSGEPEDPGFALGVGIDEAWGFEVDKTQEKQLDRGSTHNGERNSTHNRERGSTHNRERNSTHNRERNSTHNRERGSTHKRESTEARLGMALTAQFAETAVLQREMENGEGENKYEPPAIAPEHKPAIQSPFEVDAAGGDFVGNAQDSFGADALQQSFAADFEASFEPDFHHQSFPPPESAPEKGDGTKKDSKKNRTNRSSLGVMTGAMKAMVDGGAVVGRGVVQAGAVAAQGVAKGGTVVGRGVVQAGAVVGTGVVQAGAVVGTGVVQGSAAVGRGVVQGVMKGGGKENDNKPKKEKKSPPKRRNSMPTSSEPVACVACGSTSAPPGSRFCPDCGSSMLNSVNSAPSQAPTRRLSLGEKSKEDDGAKNETKKRLPRRTNSTGADAKTKDTNKPVRRLSLGGKPKEDGGVKKDTKKRTPRRTNSIGAEAKASTGRRLSLGLGGGSSHGPRTEPKRRTPRRTNSLGGKEQPKEKPKDNNDTPSKEKRAFNLGGVGGKLKGGAAGFGGAMANAGVLVAKAGAKAGGGVATAAKAVGKGTVNASVNTGKFMRGHLSTASREDDSDDEDDFDRTGFAKLE